MKYKYSRKKVENILGRNITDEEWENFKNGAMKMLKTQCEIEEDTTEK